MFLFVFLLTLSARADVECASRIDRELTTLGMGTLAHLSEGVLRLKEAGTSTFSRASDDQYLSALPFREEYGRILIVHKPHLTLRLDLNCNLAALTFETGDDGAQFVLTPMACALLSGGDPSWASVGLMKRPELVETAKALCGSEFGS